MRRAERSILKVAMGCAAAACALSVTSPASADWDLQMAMQMGGGWLRQMPSYDVDQVETPSGHRLRDSSFGPKGGLAMGGVGMDFTLTLDDRYQLGLIGFNNWWTLGEYDRQLTSADGAPIHFRPGSTFRGDVLGPGFGRRFKWRRESFAVAIQTGITWTSASASVAGATALRQIDVSSVSPLLQVEIEGCRRLDPTTRLCLQIAPRLYEYQWLNGVTVGLRMEWGR